LTADYFRISDAQMNEMKAMIFVLCSIAIGCIVQVRAASAVSAVSAPVFDADLLLLHSGHR
jgi:hypothetical protein